MNTEMIKILMIGIATCVTPFLLVVIGTLISQWISTKNREEKWQSLFVGCKHGLYFALREASFYYAKKMVNL